MHEADPPPRRHKRVEPAVQEAVEACTAFIVRFDLPEDDVPAQKVEEDQERAYIQCHFNRARAYSKLDTVAMLGASLKEYELITAYLARNQVDSMQEELQVCKEMTTLLPHKIKNAMRATTARAA
jgi:hypothetical protein